MSSGERTRPAPDRVRSYYDRYWTSDGWPESAPHGRLSSGLRQAFRRFIGPTDAVLDVGCGDGTTYGVWVAERSGRYVGVDISATAVDAANKRGLEAKTIEDATSLPFPAASFDVCLTIEVLEHLVFPEEAVREVWRVLKPGGLLIASVPNIAYWRWRLDLALLGRWHPGGHPDGASYPWRDPHLRFFTPRTFGAFLRQCDFEVETLTGINGSVFGDLPFVSRRFGTERLSRPFGFLDRLAPTLFGASILAVGRRP
jgi:methionine biosynthesis protein MetW